MRIAFILLFLVLLLHLISFAQNQLRVEVFAGSSLSERRLSWFIDFQQKSGSQIVLQVRDMRNGQFIENCIINAEAYAFDRSFGAKIPSTAFVEVQPGLYVLRVIDGLLKAVFNKGGVVTIIFSVSKQGYLPVQLTYQFMNADYLTGFATPSKNIWLDTPSFLTKRADDPSVSCKTNQGEYYAAWIKLEHNNQVVDLIVPVNKANHKVPANWDFYSQTAKALIVADNYQSFRAEQVIALKDDINKIQKQIMIVYTSGKSIDLFVGLLNTLIKGAVTGGSSIYFDVKRTVAFELGKYFISAEIDPMTHTERYFLNVILKNLNRVQDSLDVILPMINRMQEQQPKLTDVELSQLYSKWKYALITTAMSMDLARSQYVNKSVGRKMLEAQIETVLSSAIPEQTKVVQLARFLQSNELALIEAMKSTQVLERSFHNAFERHWLPDGPARNAFETLRGKSIKMDVTSSLPVIDQFICRQINGFNKLQWTLSATNSTNKFVIKYSDKQITESNWHQAYYTIMPTLIQPAGKQYEFTPTEHNERRPELYFAIRYVDENGRASAIRSCYCAKATASYDGIDSKHDRTNSSEANSSSSVNKFNKPAGEPGSNKRNTGIIQKIRIDEQSKKNADYKNTYNSGNFEQSSPQNNLTASTSNSYGEKWKIFSNEYYEFIYPESWKETMVGTEYAVARYAQDTVYFVVSLLECQQNVAQEDLYGNFHNGFACGMIRKFNNEPSSYLSIGFQEGMSISQPFQTINGNYNWKFIAFKGPALNFGQSLEMMEDNIRRKTDKLEKKDSGPQKQFSKRIYHLCNAATLYKNNVLVTASAVAHNPEDDKLNDIFIKMIKSLKVNY